MSEMRLYDIQGNRLYLGADECSAFLAAAWKRPPDERTFAETLTFKGCRISEALEITPPARGTGERQGHPRKPQEAPPGAEEISESISDRRADHPKFRHSCGLWVRRRSPRD